MGISWGGVIASTVVGLDDRFAWGIPVYGNGHKYYIPNYIGNALGGNDVYREVWDPYLYMDAVQTPMLWLSYPRENNFSLDSQAATYLKAPGPRMVSLVPGMGHGHGPGWRRPESYAFADTMVAAGRPWAVQRELESMYGSARWVVVSERPLDRATLIYATDFGYTGDFDWVEIPVASFEEGPAGTWAARVELPEETTGWFFNAYTAAEGPELVVSSDYQEMITVMPFPDGRIELNHPAGIDRSTGQIEMGFTGPSFVEIVAVDVVESSHPGACASDDELPIVLFDDVPSTTRVRVTFDNTVAQLDFGEVASCLFSFQWASLDGRLHPVEVPVSISIVENRPFELNEEGLLDEYDIYNGADVTVAQGGQIQLSGLAEVDSLNIDGGSLELIEGSHLVVTGELNIGEGGHLVVNGGRLELLQNVTRVNGLLQLNQGEIVRNMAGVGGRLTGEGRIEVAGGHFNFGGGQPTNVLVVDVDMSISDGRVSLSGQVYIGQEREVVFEMIGSDPQVSILRLNTGGGRRGIYRFVLDENGVASITVPGWMNFNFGRVVVDGGAYRGGPAEIVLLDSLNLVEVTADDRLSVEGFEDNEYAARIVQDQAAGREWVQLIVEDAP